MVDTVGFIGAENKFSAVARALEQAALCRKNYAEWGVPLLLHNARCWIKYARAIRRAT